MKTQETPQNPNPRESKHSNSGRAALAASGSQTRKLPLMLAFALMVHVASSAQAVIKINADEVGGNVVFTLSGSLNTGSLDSTMVVNDSSHFHGDYINLFRSGAPPGFYWEINFGTPLPLAGVNQGILANLTGPFTFGTAADNISASHPSTNPGSFFEFGHFINADLGFVSFPLSYSNLAPLSASMSFTGTFSSLNLAPGIYEWNWFNSSNKIHDSAILQIGSVPEPSATMLIAIGLAALGWFCRKIVA